MLIIFTKQLSETSDKSQNAFHVPSSHPTTKTKINNTKVLITLFLGIVKVQSDGLVYHNTGKKFDQAAPVGGETWVEVGANWRVGAEVGNSSIVERLVKVSGVGTV